MTISDSGRRGLTCFVSTWLNILESCAVGQEAEFAVAVIAIKLLCLAIGDVLKFRCILSSRAVGDYFFTDMHDKCAAVHHLHSAVLGAAEAAHNELTVLKHKVGGSGVVEVQVPQDVAVMVQHAGPEPGIDARAALFTLSCAGRLASQRQVCCHLTPADSTHTQH